MLHYRLHNLPGSSHQQIAQLLRQRRPERTLDVGCAQGMLGQLLHDANLTLDAVELNPAWAAAARPFYRTVHPVPIEQASLPPGSYDAIVCADVLEHLVDPLATLQQLRRVATPEALFIISLPNVAHLAIRLMLLAGRFPKMDRGILDRTHLHFYTRSTATGLLHAAGLQIDHIATTGIPLDELCPAAPRLLLDLAARTQHLATRLLPRLFAFQWIFLARPGASA